MIAAFAMAIALSAAAPAAVPAPAPAPAPAAAPPDVAILNDASEAIGAGRLEEGRLIIARAIAEGFKGPAIQRLEAELAFASGNYTEAWSDYRQLAGTPGRQEGDCEKGGIAALKIAKLADAAELLQCATNSPLASWRAWNARGVLADLQHDWTGADQSYSHASQMAPGEARIVNNEGWSKLLRGDWSTAVRLFEEAVALGSNSERIANNLELARAALANNLPERANGETNQHWAVRLNDAGVAAELVGDKKRAISAFTQALEASPTWYDRASNNLKLVSEN